MDDLRLHARDDDEARGARTAGRVRDAGRAAPWGPIRLEIIEPLDDRSIYEGSLRRHGNRDHFHHLQIEGDWDETIGNLEALGVPVSQSGAAGGVEWAYFDTDDELGFAIEITRRAEGFRFPEPSGVYPVS